MAMYGGLWLRLGLFGPFGSLWALHPQSNSWGRLLNSPCVISFAYLNQWANMPKSSKIHLWKSNFQHQKFRIIIPRSSKISISSAPQRLIIACAVGINFTRTIKISPQLSGSTAFLNCWTTVDGRNPAPVDMVKIPSFTRFYTSQVVQDFFHQQY